MARPVKAFINHELLVWARRTASLSLADGAKAAKVSEAVLTEWEQGGDAPTITKLRLLAKAYKRPLAVFYLPEPPLDFSPLKDFRRLPGEIAGLLSPALAAQINAAHERRELALELYDQLGEAPAPIALAATLATDPDQLGRHIRTMLGITLTVQQTWRDDRIAYNTWRRRIEDAGVLVFQLTKVGVKEARGFAIAKQPVPVIAVNARDWYTARSFSLLHELAHLILGESSISDYSDATDSEARPPEANRIEVFCNAVAAATLIPKDDLLAMPLVARHNGMTWSDEDLAALGKTFGVSDEAILRRLLTLGKTSRAFYSEKRRAYEELTQRLASRKSKGGPKPHELTLGRYGSGFSRLVLQGYYQRRLTLSDVSGYLGIKLPWIGRLEAAAYGKAA